MITTTNIEVIEFTKVHHRTLPSEKSVWRRRKNLSVWVREKIYFLSIFYQCLIKDKAGFSHSKRHTKVHINHKVPFYVIKVTKMPLSVNHSLTKTCQSHSFLFLFVTVYSTSYLHLEKLSIIHLCFINFLTFYSQRLLSLSIPMFFFLLLKKLFTVNSF